ncbi:MAG: hypothetical protein IKC70_09085 [Bacteroidaceae bacterium]|nr:hypothetical protein [Bacteroidaceae bacterium]
MMKRVCKRPVIIDAFTVCCEVGNSVLFNKIASLEFGESIEFEDFTLTRIDGRYYNYVNTITYNDCGEIKTFGQLKFGLNNGNDEAHNNGKPKAWITIDNTALYSQAICYLGYICEILHLNVHNFTSIDLCKDTPFDVSRALHRLYRNKSITIILNGKRIINRDEDRPEISRTLSGSLNKDKYQTIYVKQRNAIRDKSAGVTIKTYDKLTEIRNASEKEYILDYYSNPTNLYRTEVHLNNADIKEYLQSHNIDLNPYMMDNAVLEAIFFDYLNRVIRFQDGNVQITWEQLLGGRTAS